MTHPDYAIIYNPSSAAGKSQADIAAAQKYLTELGISFSLHKSEYAGHAIELARQLSKEGYRVIGAGGDGTCNEVFHGVITSGSGNLCGFIPMGSGNDIPAAIGIRPNIKRACEIIADGKTGKSDIGFAHTDSGVERYFLGIGSQGFDAEVTRRTNAGEKKYQGSTNYVVNVLKTIAAWKNKEIRVIMDNDKYEGKSNCIAVGNGPSYGGFMYICPQARVHDGLFHISVINMNKFKLLIDFNQMYSASLFPHKNIFTYTSKKVRIEMIADQKNPYICQVDGEILGDIPVTYEAIADGYEFIQPTSDEVCEDFTKKYGRPFYQNIK